MSSQPYLNPKELKELLVGPFTHPAPPLAGSDVRELHLYLCQVLYYLSIDWYRPPAAELFLVVGAASDVTGAFGPADVVIGIRNVDKKVTKEVLQKISDQCQVLYPFLLHDISSPSLRVTCGLTTNIACYIDTYVTPKGIKTMHRSFRSDQPQQLSIMMNMTPNYDFMSLGEWLFGFIRRLNLACDPQLMLSMRGQEVEWSSIDWQQTQWGNHRRFPSLLYDRGGTVKIGKLFLKFCKNCSSCRIQSTKAKSLLVGGFNFEVRVAVMQCIPALNDVTCSNNYFNGSLTVLGPGSLPVLPEPGIQPWVSRLCDWDSFGLFTGTPTSGEGGDKKHVCDASIALKNSNSNLHLLLIFQCDQVTEDNINQIMPVLRDNCFMILGNHLSSLKTAVNRCMGKFYQNKEKASAHKAMILESSRRLANGISEIVKFSNNSDFKDSVSRFFPHSTDKELESLLCERSVELGQKALNVDPKEKSEQSTTQEESSRTQENSTQCKESAQSQHNIAVDDSVQSQDIVADDFDQIAELCTPPQPSTPRLSKRRRISMREEDIQVERFLSRQDINCSPPRPSIKGTGSIIQCNSSDWTSDMEIQPISYPEIRIEQQGVEKCSSDFDDLGSEDYVLYQNCKLGPTTSVTPTKGFEDKESFKVAGIHIFSQDMDDFDLLDDV